MKLSLVLRGGPSEVPGPCVVNRCSCSLPVAAGTGSVGRHRGIMDERHIAPGWTEGGETCGCEPSDRWTIVTSSPNLTGSGKTLNKWTNLAEARSTASSKLCKKKAPHFFLHFFRALCAALAQRRQISQQVSVGLQGGCGSNRWSSCTKENINTAWLKTLRLNLLTVLQFVLLSNISSIDAGQRSGISRLQGLNGLSVAVGV